MESKLLKPGIMNKLLGNRSRENRTLWLGSIRYADESLNVRLKLIERAGAFSGDLQVVDSMNSQLVQIGIIVEGTRTAASITFVTNTDLQFTGSLHSGSLVGTLVFPPHNGEQGPEADVNLIEEHIEYLPSILR